MRGARRGGTRAARAAGRARRRPWPLAPVCACWGRKAGEAAPAGGGKQGSCWRRGMSREGRRAGKIAGEGNEQCRGGERAGEGRERALEDCRRAAPAGRRSRRGRSSAGLEEQRRRGGATPAGEAPLRRASASGSRVCERESTGSKVIFPRGRLYSARPKKIARAAARPTKRRLERLLAAESPPRRCWSTPRRRGRLDRA